jgi:hypothetical protein
MKNKLSKIGMSTILAIATTLVTAHVALAFNGQCGTTPGPQIDTATGDFCNTTAPSCYVIFYDPPEQYCQESSPDTYCHTAQVAGTVTTYPGSCSWSGCTQSGSGTTSHPQITIVDDSGNCQTAMRKSHSSSIDI